MKDEFSYKGHQFCDITNYIFNKVAKGTFRCKICDLDVFVGAKSPGYSGTYFDGRIVNYDIAKSSWIEDFLSCNEVIVKKLLE